jgi:protein-S-isoprenylcysteine O-methyltransferase Ste14
MLKLPPPIWALIYLAIAVALSLTYAWRALVDLRVVPLGITLIAIGATSMFWAVSVFRSAGTELNPTSETNKRLVVQGPFRITRNPMYLGIVLVSLGIAFWVGSLPMFAVPILAFATANWVHIPFEEAKMRRQFGTAFDAYTAKVRRWV